MNWKKVENGNGAILERKFRSVKSEKDGVSSFACRMTQGIFLVIMIEREPFCA